MADNFPKLIKLRDLACTQIKIILRFAKTINAETNFESITVRRNLLETRYRTFSELEHQLFDDPNYVSISEAVDEIYFEAQGLLKRACADYNQEEQTNPHDLNVTLEKFVEQQKTFYEGVNNTSHHVRLPKVNIEQFSGDYKNWASFHDLYRTTVHDNRNISNVHKLQILKGLLSGEAAALIRHIPVTENNYAEAWDKICNRYNKMTPIVTSLIKTFFDQKPCSQANARELRRVTESSDEIIRGLRALGPDAETRDPWLTHIVLSKIDSETKRLWANESVGKDFSKFDTLLKFLNKRCDALEICDTASKKGSTKSFSSFIAKNSSTTVECIACRQQHLLFRCPEFNNKTVEARTKFVNEKDLCSNCLRRGHTTTKCFSKSSCRLCNGRHHTSLHTGHVATQPDSSKSSTYLSLNEPMIEAPKKLHIVSSQNSINSQTTNTQVYHNFCTSLITVLPTAIVYVESRTGELQPYRALLDSGAQSSLVTESCAQRLNLKRSQASTTLYGLASNSAGTSKENIAMTIHSHVDKRYIFNTSCHVINNITTMLPIHKINYNKQQTAGFELADPQFFIPNRIDILLGADVFFKMLNPESRTIEGLPTLQSSKLGWLIAGTVNIPQSSVSNLHTIIETNIDTTIEEVHKSLQTCWEGQQEAEPVKHCISINPSGIHDEQTTIKNPHARIVVSLPFEESKSSLGSSCEAKQKLLRMESKYSRIAEFLEPYKPVKIEYSVLSRITYLPLQKIPDQDNDKFYLPHRVVDKARSVRTSGTSNKLKAVDDSSCKTSPQVSLKNVLQIGPSIQIDLTTILVKLRRPTNNLAVNVKIMDQQIYINPVNTNYQSIKWHENAVSQEKPTKRGKRCRKGNIITNTGYIDDLFTGRDCFQMTVLHKQQTYEALTKPHPVIYPNNSGRDIHSIVQNPNHIRSFTNCNLHRFNKPKKKPAKLAAVRYIQSRPFIKAKLNFARDAIYSKDSFDTASLMTALIRCISRRRTPEEIWCGNTAKLIIANRKRQRLKTQIPNQSRNTLIFVFSLQKSLIFHFSPPHIDICKMNHSSDVEVPTPACFTVRKPITTIPEPKLAEVTLNQVSYWPTIQQRLQSSVQQTSRKATINAVIGVLIRQLNLYTSQWMMGRIKKKKMFIP